MIDGYNIKIFADGADYNSIMDLYEDERIDGFTTNPTLLRKAGVENYEQFAKKVLKTIKDKPISFEVFDDSLEGMINQAETISSWGENVYVKIPVMNTKGIRTSGIVEYLSNHKIKINVTAILDQRHAEDVFYSLNEDTPAIVSVFAGRIANTLVDPCHLMKHLASTYSNETHELLWASTRELLNISQANDAGVEIITVSPQILKNIPLIGKDLQEYSLETVKMFYCDAQEAGYTI